MPETVTDDLMQPEHGVHRLYTSAMIAEVLGVPPAAVRHWVRERLLEPVRRSGSLEWFDFSQLVVGRNLSRLLSGGLSLREIDAKLAGLTAGDAAMAAQAADRIVADGRRLSIRHGDRLLGAGGQLQLPFYTSSLAAADEPHDSIPAVRLIDMAAARDAVVPRRRSPNRGLNDDTAEILDLADDLEAAGEFAEAAEALRAVLQAQGPSAAVMFMLAELLYRAGDLTAARERYYATIEIDPEHLRARASLGCVLAELGEHELALAALEGVLRQEPDYADAHWHIAGVLADMGRARDARHHLATFLTLAPESPWAALARQRLGQ
jgi:tetratricopeptide (TPR) repeat protein